MRLTSKKAVTPPSFAIDKKGLNMSSSEILKKCWKTAKYNEFKHLEKRKE
jgi:hypothetical protein